jgi:hypothetical protein
MRCPRRHPVSRGVIHLHAVTRLDHIDPAAPDQILPPAGLDAADLVDAVDHAANVTGYTTRPHPARPEGWRIAWGEHVHTKVITVAAKGQIADGYVAAYLAKYATKSTEVTGHLSSRLTDQTIGCYADPDGTHTQRLVEACWMLGQPKQWRRLRLWAHQLGFGSHFLTKSRRHRVTFALLRNNRVVFRRTASPGPTPSPRPPSRPRPWSSTSSSSSAPAGTPPATPAGQHIRRNGPRARPTAREVLTTALAASRRNRQAGLARNRYLTTPQRTVVRHVTPSKLTRRPDRGTAPHRSSTMITSISLPPVHPGRDSPALRSTERR